MTPARAALVGTSLDVDGALELFRPEFRSSVTAARPFIHERETQYPTSWGAVTAAVALLLLVDAVMVAAYLWLL